MMHPLASEVNPAAATIKAAGLNRDAGGGIAYSLY
jgi:hypothetical protein